MSKNCNVNYLVACHQSVSWPIHHYESTEVSRSLYLLLKKNQTQHTCGFIRQSIIKLWITKLKQKLGSWLLTLQIDTVVLRVQQSLESHFRLCFDWYILCWYRCSCNLVHCRLKEWYPACDRRPHHQELRQVPHVIVTKYSTSPTTEDNGGA